MKKNGRKLNPAVLMDYDRWVTEHLDEMVRKYPGNVIAVYRGKLVAVGDTYKEVFATARAQGIREQPLAMEVPRLEDFEAILFHEHERFVSFLPVQLCSRKSPNRHRNP